ncbi:MAG: helix-turn-helix domain-containing protein [Paracoccaceae bacterium]|nr:helix-turn-helix domain-containing protein [Paracoccaceae bacterium]
MRPGDRTGARIRRRRLDRGIKQADLARACDISPSYLNLIEHDRRRIGGKLLADLAEVLDVSPERLRTGADPEEIAGLRAAAADTPRADVELDRVEDFAARFPGWAGLVAEQARRVASLERTVEIMGDRMTHDPQLAASLHNILSTVTAIRSTSAILAGDDPVEPGWQTRFHRNLYEDSQRLAEATEALVGDLDADAGAEAGATPLDQVEEWFDTAAELAALEPGGAGAAALFSRAEADLPSAPARALARREIARAAADAKALPAASLRREIGRSVPDPLHLADRFGVPLAAVFRRLAALGDIGAGLVVCDGSGTLTRRRPIPGFPVPRFGAACPVWPLYAALLQIGRPVSASLLTAGQGGARFRAWAIAETAHPGGYGGVAVTEATMLVSPVAGGDGDAAADLVVGSSCRVCPAESCAARRELSILGAGL